MNERIRAREIRVIDDDGSQLGIMTPRDAMMIARERGIDLIEVAPQAQPPVCKIMDYGKFKYEQAKKEKDSAKKHKQSELKGIQMFPNIEEHDFVTKVKSAIKFLADGDKVKVTIRFKGRQITHPEFGRQQMDKVIQMTSQVGQVEKPTAMEGRMMTMILSPLKSTGGPKPGEHKSPDSKPAAPKPSQPKPVAAAPAPPVSDADAPLSVAPVLEASVAVAPEASASPAAEAATPPVTEASAPEASAVKPAPRKAAPPKAAEETVAQEESGSPVA